MLLKVSAYLCTEKDILIRYPDLLDLQNGCILL